MSVRPYRCIAWLSFPLVAVACASPGPSEDSGLDKAATPVKSAGTIDPSPATSSGGSCGDPSCGGSSSGGSSSGGSSSGGSSSGGSSSGGGGSSSGGTVEADLHAVIDVCGVVSAFAAATAEKTGTVTIAGKQLGIASGTSLVGQALLSIGANVCIHAELDASGALRAPSSVSLDLLGSARVHICGTVRAYVAACATDVGSLRLGGCGLTIATGALVSGEALLKVGASVCVDAKLTAEGQLTACSVGAD
jgi:hypothetical protein